MYIYRYMCNNERLFQWRTHEAIRVECVRRSSATYKANAQKVKWTRGSQCVYSLVVFNAMGKRKQWTRARNSFLESMNAMNDLRRWNGNAQSKCAHRKKNTTQHQQLKSQQRDIYLLCVTFNCWDTRDNCYAAIITCAFNRVSLLNTVAG